MDCAYIFIISKYAWVSILYTVKDISAIIIIYRALLQVLESAQPISRTSWGEPAGANRYIKIIFKTRLSSIKHSCEEAGGGGKPYESHKITMKTT